jgi:hypothetical protein
MTTEAFAPRAPSMGLRGTAYPRLDHSIAQGRAAGVGRRTGQEETAMSLEALGDMEEFVAAF